MVVRTESLRIPNWHDTGSTSPRSGSEVALIWDTISHYSPVLIAPLAINFIAPARPEKKERIAVKPTRQPSTQREATLTGRPFFTKSPADGLVAAPQAGTGALDHDVMDDPVVVAGLLDPSIFAGTNAEHADLRSNFQLSSTSSSTSRLQRRSA